MRNNGLEQDLRPIAEYLAIHYSAEKLAKATLDALHISWPAQPEERKNLIELVAAPRCSRTMALIYLDIALANGMALDQFPDAFLDHDIIGY